MQQSKIISSKTLHQDDYTKVFKVEIQKRAEDKGSCFTINLPL